MPASVRRSRRVVKEQGLVAAEDGHPAAQLQRLGLLLTGGGVVGAGIGGPLGGPHGVLQGAGAGAPPAGASLVVAGAARVPHGLASSCWLLVGRCSSPA